MIKLFSYLKPYWAAILLAVCFLFFQVNTELALPDLMSRIVNTGIQQKGVESAVPVVISGQTLNSLILFYSGDRQDIEKLYLPDSVLSESAGQSVFSLRKDVELSEETNNDFQNIWLLKSLTAQIDGNPPFPGMDNMPEGFPADMDLMKMLTMASAEQKALVLSGIYERLSEFPESSREQMAVQAVLQEYEMIGYDTNTLRQHFVLKTGGTMLLYTLASVLAAIFVSFLASRISAGTARNIRRDLFEHIENFTNAEFDKFSTASLITRSTNDIVQVQRVIFMIIRMVVYAPLMGVGGVLRAYGKAPSMSWLIALAVIVLLGLVGVLMANAVPRFQIVQNLVDKLNLVSRENLSGMLVVRAFNRQPLEEGRFDAVNVDLTDNNRFLMRLMALMMPAITLIMNILTVAIVWVGAHQIADSAMQVGDMMAFLQYAIQIVMSFLMISMLFIFLPRAAVSGKRIAEVLYTKPSVNDPEKPVSLKGQTKGVLEFRDVSFRYPGADENAICGINFTAEPGKTTAFIGSTGSGKSTIVNLIPRFYDCTEGSILLDGVDIRELTQHELREQVSYIPQKSVLFSGSIRSNLKYADKNADDECLEEALLVAQGKEILDKPEGLGESVSQGGSNFSGGQRQRLAIARALVKKAPILIFDDSFSALDFKTDRALREQLKTHSADKALIIVAQRVSTIMNADQIIVMDEGKAVGMGSHKKLMETCEAYREIVYSQIDKEELA